MQTELIFSNVHENSIDTYRDKILPTLSKRRQDVLNAIIELGGETTLYNVGQLLGRELGTISGRITELKLAGIIEETGAIKIINNRSFSILKLK